MMRWVESINEIENAEGEDNSPLKPDHTRCFSSNKQFKGINEPK
jgi:hypothetical protein